MDLECKQVSSLEKLTVYSFSRSKTISKRTLLAGERFSYQIGIKSKKSIRAVVSIESELRDNIKLYAVKNVIMDKPATEEYMENENYITLEPGLMPDMLLPLEEQNNVLSCGDEIMTVWVRLDVPADVKPGTYELTVNFELTNIHKESEKETVKKTMIVEAISAAMPEQKLIYTRWLYADCIANQHNVEIHSSEYWDWIEKYIAAAVDVGINMILVPVHTPPLDTAIDTQRPCVQLVDIEKKGDKYEFSFKNFKKFIDICKKCGIKYYEIAHMFSQWGAKYAPNIMVTENGKKDYMFGWHVPATSKEYSEFLPQYIAAISEEVKREGISENTYFHISDEPALDNIENYKMASDMMRSLIGKSKTFDALSRYEFYEKGLIKCPVTSVKHIHEFLEHEVENQWVYYCCNPQKVYSNSFIAMPSCRTRVLGYQLYRYDIKGFLHWGYNFYNSQISLYEINPYLTTSANGAFPSGDPFIVYPGKDTVYPSIRGEVIYEAIQDMNICFALEALIGRTKVVKMIDKAAGRTLRFDDYPCSNEFVEGLRAAMIRKISAIQS